MTCSYKGRGANLRGIDFYKADLTGTNLVGADLTQAKLVRADLYGADLTRAILNKADLTGANLIRTNFTSADLTDVDFSQTSMLQTILAQIDLREVRGLEEVKEAGPSIIGIDTIYRSQAQIPPAFLRGAGVPELFIEYMSSLVSSPIEYYTCFIAYSSKDQDFANRIYTDLQRNGVRCWYAPESLQVGDNYLKSIDESIRIYDKLLLILSEHSVNSRWVEREVAAAIEKEYRSQNLVLFPITLDSEVRNTSQPWAADIRRTRHSGDFTGWHHHDMYRQALNRLLRELHPGRS